MLTIWVGPELLRISEIENILGFYSTVPIKVHYKMVKNLRVLLFIAQLFFGYSQTKEAFEFKKDSTSTSLSSAVLLNGPDINDESFVICSSHYQKQFNTRVYVWVPKLF